MLWTVLYAIHWPEVEGPLESFSAIPKLREILFEWNTKSIRVLEKKRKKERSIFESLFAFTADKTDSKYGNLGTKDKVNAV